MRSSERTGEAYDLYRLGLLETLLLEIVYKLESYQRRLCATRSELHELMRIGRISGRAEGLIRKRVLWVARPSTAVVSTSALVGRGAHRTL